MAAKCVPVVSDLPGVRDLVGDVGEVVPTRDHLALRASLLGLAADPERLAALGVAARTRAKEMSWDACVARYEAAFRSAVRSAGDGIPAPRSAELAGDRVGRRARAA
jgi:rhamnosyl/mannosyltransferase